MLKVQLKIERCSVKKEQEKPMFRRANGSQARWETFDHLRPSDTQPACLTSEMTEVSMTGSFVFITPVPD